MDAPVPDPAQIARFAAMLDENARLHARIDPSLAAMLAYFARAFAGHAAIAALAAPPPAPRRPPRLVNSTQQKAAGARADEWLQSYLRAALPDFGGTPPSNRAIFKAAAQARGLDLPRRVIEKAIYRRWPEREPAPKK
jgi:hypothetical protein